MLNYRQHIKSLERVFNAYMYIFYINVKLRQEVVGGDHSSLLCFYLISVATAYDGISAGFQLMLREVAPSIGSTLGMSLGARGGNLDLWVSRSTSKESRRHLVSENRQYRMLRCLIY